ncbi:acetolactate synthase large subunit [Neorhizobium alkalisoli]|uniref:Acetolactate synthase-1/2/3 large subunit n=1 Tax=Neorhizobium alkalisoli TaxID=528178 RepID=A0A561QAN9_9HYPH|nr:acetolactate synthase large subunit [Neorhizobium alkalisoli]TWF47425.1 acetolactate synthase-1/2/3 large subunit [Neorhizobium alkalisoli]
MNGAESVVATLVEAGVEVCFANPGTSELHLVAALDRVPGMRCVLCLFEGGVTGAADGYARMTGKPAATLLHLGPGLMNAGANLHNARRAHSPVLNLVGEHATYHLQYDAPLTSDIAAVAGAVSAHIATASAAETVSKDAAEALAAAQTGQGRVSTLIIPADVAWGEGGVVASPVAAPARRTVSDELVKEAAAALGRGQAMILVGNGALMKEPLIKAAAVAQATSARLASIGRNPRLQRGVGTPVVERLSNPASQQIKQLGEIRNLILVGEEPPVAFFAHPDRPSVTTHPDCNIIRLADVHDDISECLDRLAAATGADIAAVPLQQLVRPDIPTGPITPDTVAMAVGALMPENCIVADESITVGRSFYRQTAGAPAHDWLHLPGGAIGIGIPLATGAAVACPDRKVINLQADGSGMYTLQALWTQVRENLNVLTVIWSNRSYKILRDELSNVGLPDPGPTALGMLDLSNPPLDWVSLARGMGADGRRVSDMDGFVEAFRDGLARNTPYLIEVEI